MTDYFEYDLFFSHSSRNICDVKQLITRLGQSPYNIRCACADDDFVPGWTVTKNIEHFILRSRKTVALITPDFTNSRWCDYETSVLHTLDMEENRNRLIPVLFKDCDLPLMARVTSYIDARLMGVEELSSQLFKALNTDDLSSVTLNVKKEIVNGTVYEIFARRCSTMGFVFSDLTKLEVMDLQYMKIKDPKYVYFVLARELNKSSLVKHHLMFTGSCASCFWTWYISIIFYLGVTVILMTLMILSSTIAQGLQSSMVSIYPLAATDTSFLVLFIIRFYLKTKLKSPKSKQLQSFLLDRNIELSQNHCTLADFVVDKDQSFVPALRLLYYDMTQCRECLKDWGLWCDEISNKHCRKQCSVKTYLTSYVELLQAEESKKSQFQVDNDLVRHVTKDRLMCFCQYVEHMRKREGLPTCDRGNQEQRGLSYVM